MIALLVLGALAQATERRAARGELGEVKQIGESGPVLLLISLHVLSLEILRTVHGAQP